MSPTGRTLVGASTALVAVAALFLVAGFAFGDGLALIDLSIVCSAAAGAVLYAAVRQRELPDDAERDVNGAAVG